MKRWFANAFKRHETLTIQVMFFFAIWILGAIGYWQSWGSTPSNIFLSIIEYFYRSLQLFGLNHNGNDLKADYDWTLNLARFLAPAFLVSAVISLISGAVLRFFKNCYHLAFSRSRVVILGYGLIGQALAAGLRKTRLKNKTGFWHVTAVAPKIDTEMARAAGRDGVALFEDDPSDPALFGRIKARHVSRVYVALENDLENLAAAESFKKWWKQVEAAEAKRSG